MAVLLGFGFNAKAQTFVPDPTVALESFTQFEVQFDNVDTTVPNSFDWNKKTITILKNGEAYNDKVAELACDKTNFKGIVKIKYSESITAAGEYTFIVPEGAFSYYDKDTWRPTTSPAFEVTYTVGVQEPEPVNFTCDPDPSVRYESIKNFTISFPDIQGGFLHIPNKTVTVLKDGQATTEKVVISAAGNGNNVLATSQKGDITDPGVYTFQIPEGITFFTAAADGGDITIPAFEVTYYIVLMSLDLENQNLTIANISFR